jgi:hypothetical protein
MREARSEFPQPAGDANNSCNPGLAIKGLRQHQVVVTGTVLYGLYCKFVPVSSHESRVTHPSTRTCNPGNHSQGCTDVIAM